ncbi:EAL domain-containing protein [Phycisphaerales bacterium AB-hyl4]|uniref:EAL domain-containing protein n=1 Tax=Natronomicrosphaera hydrolytica TaxID=3242702 RepID=A0ABV4U9X1_9BACT
MPGATADSTEADVQITRQHTALTSLMRILASETLELPAVFREITRTVAETLNIERASIWRVNDTGNAIVCHDLYESSQQRHSAGCELHAAQYPRYFQAMAECEVICADDAHADPRTCEFSQTYLDPLGINSMLDAPIQLRGGQVDGVLCLEHVGPQRSWTSLEQTFTLSIANLVSLLLTQRQRKQIEQESHTLLESLPQLVWILQPDRYCLHVNKQWVDFTGLSAAESLGFGWTQALHPDDLDNINEQAEQTVRDDGVFEMEYRVRRADGVYQWMLGRALPLRDASGETVRWLGTATNIDLMKQVEARLEQVTDRFEAAVTGTSDGLFDWWVGSSEIWFAPRFWELLGFTAQDELPAGTFDVWAERLHPDERELVLAALDQHIHNGEKFDLRYRLRTVAGDYRWFHVRAASQKNECGQVIRMSGSIQDVTDRKRLEDELRAAARIDKLTGLPNRALLMDRLQQAIERNKRSSESCYAVLFLDFDRFKMVNDSLGHEVGDLLLQEIALRLQTAVRSADTVGRPTQKGTAARLGGDEFVVLLDSLRTVTEVQTVTDRVLKALDAPYQIRHHRIVSTASIGIVTSAFGHERAEDVLRDADIAMYEAKSAGRNRTALFDASMLRRVQRKAELEVGLRLALETDQFHLEYQPIVSLETRRLRGFEALVRWQHPQEGLIPPGEFIPVAEDTGLMVVLGEWVFRRACQQLAVWWQTLGREAIPSLSVNLSRTQLAVPELAERLNSIAREEGVDPSAIHLEITETTITLDPDQAARIIKSLKAFGFKIDLDDFGTGYAAMANLHMFHVDVLKVDRSFVANLHRGREFTAMVNAIITLADNLNMTLIAEGVETDEQVAILQSLDCQFAQGYLFARPLPADHVVAFINKHKAQVAGC